MFISTVEKYINASHIKLVEVLSDNKMRITLSDERVTLAAHIDSNTPVEFHPAHLEYESVIICKETDGSYWLDVIPIIGWITTLSGSIVPYTADGIIDYEVVSYGIRKKGETHVYVEQVATFKDADDYLEYYQKKEKPAKKPK